MIDIVIALFIGFIAGIAFGIALIVLIAMSKDNEE